MIRAVIDGILIFLIPFAVWWGVQSWRLKDPKAAMRIEKGPLAWLSIIGLILCIGTIIATEMMAAPHQDGYQRAQWKDGKLIPGEAR
jgi:hypothetical protein